MRPTTTGARSPSALLLAATLLLALAVGPCSAAAAAEAATGAGAAQAAAKEVFPGLLELTSSSFAPDLKNVAERSASDSWTLMEFYAHW